MLVGVVSARIKVSSYEYNILKFIVDEVCSCGNTRLKTSNEYTKGMG